MKSRESNVDYLFSRTNLYRVPLYQRHYVWNEKNWEDLWTDIKDKSNLRLDSGKGRSVKTHFTGAIVIQPDAETLEIIDGQQRLTTFQIILCAIRDVCKIFDNGTNDTTNIAKTAQDRVLNDLTRFSRPSRSPEQEQRYKLLPRAGSDRQTFQCLVASEVDGARKKDKSGFIYGAYVYFTDEIKRYVTQDHRELRILLDTLIETILKDFVVVQITVDSDDDPEKIFQTINGTGRALNDFDLLRNDLFLRAGTGEERDRLYTKYWMQFENAEAFWRSGNIVDDFLADFLHVKLGTFFNDQLNLYDQYQRYRKILPERYNFKKTGLQLIEYEFPDLSRYAKNYQEIQNPNLRSEISCQIHPYEELKIHDVLRPFILYITSELGVSGSELSNILRLLESYAVRELLCDDTYSVQTHLKKILHRFFNNKNSKKSFSLIDLVYLISKWWPTNQRIRAFLNTNDPFRDSTYSGILGRIGGNSIELEESEFFERLCEIWPAREAILQSAIQGALPVVYSELSPSEPIKPRMEPYLFMTDDGMKKLSEYKIDQDSITGTNLNSRNNEKIVLAMMEIVFAFPTTSMPDLELQLNNLDEDVKNQKLTRVAELDTVQVQKWLQKHAIPTENLDSEHWFLPDIDATVVTRTGHILQGTLKSFNNDAIYMQINGQTVIVYRHGLHTLSAWSLKPKRQQMKQWRAMVEGSKYASFKFMTIEGVIELENIKTDPNTVKGVPKEKKQQVEINKEDILFAYGDAASATVEPLESSNGTEANRIIPNDYTIVITRSKHILRGLQTSYDDDAIYLRIGDKASVIVFRHGLLQD